VTSGGVGPRLLIAGKLVRRRSSGEECVNRGSQQSVNEGRAEPIQGDAVLRSYPPSATIGPSPISAYCRLHIMQMLNYLLK